jgi:hypothetical protein
VKLLAKSIERWRASALHRRLYGGATITRFFVCEAGGERRGEFVGYGPTPAARKRDAIDRARKAWSVE